MNTYAITFLLEHTDVQPHQTTRTISNSLHARDAESHEKAIVDAMLAQAEMKPGFSITSTIWMCVSGTSRHGGTIPPAA